MYNTAYRMPGNIGGQKIGALTSNRAFKHVGEIQFARKMCNYNIILCVKCLRIFVLVILEYRSQIVKFARLYGIF